MKKKKALTLVAGILVISIAQVLFQFFEMNDFIKGSIMGIGIGLLLLATVFGNFKIVK